MKIAYNESTAMKKSDLKKDLELTEKYGFDYIEIWISELKDYLLENNMDDLVNFFENNHLKPYTLCSFEDVNFRTENELKNLKIDFEWACKVSQKINNPYIVVVPTVDESMVNYSEKEVEEDSIMILNELADISEKYDVKIAFEPIGFEICCVNDLEQGYNIVEKIDRESVGLVLDAYNIYLHNGLKDIDFLDEIDYNKIFVFHIDDSDDVPLSELKLDHRDRVWPGDGIIPLDEILHKFFENDYDPIASVELFRPDVWELSPEEAIKTAKEKTEEIIEKFYK